MSDFLKTANSWWAIRLWPRRMVVYHIQSQEQEHMESKYPGLVKGKVPTYSSLTKQDFLSVLATYFKLKEDAPIARRIRAKMVEIGENEPILKPGYYKGRHYSSYPADVLDLMREGNSMS